MRGMGSLAVDAGASAGLELNMENVPRTSRRLCLWSLLTRQVTTLIFAGPFVADAVALAVSDDRGGSLEVEGGVGRCADRF